MQNVTILAKKAFLEGDFWYIVNLKLPFTDNDTGFPSIVTSATLLEEYKRAIQNKMWVTTIILALTIIDNILSDE